MNIVPLSAAQVPAHIAARKMNESFLAGLPQGGGFPTIGLKGSRFVIKADGEDKVLNTLELPVVIVAAKPSLDRAYYLGKFDPNSTEAKEPDCYSKDGVRPDAKAVCPQHSACAGCPQNQYGSSIGADGTPGKGKGCREAKVLAVFANNTVYAFKIPPASLKSLAAYFKDLARHGVSPETAMTIVGFDANFTYPVLTFNFGGYLAPEQLAKIDTLTGSPEVLEIVGGTPSAPAPVIEAPKPVEVIEEAPFAAFTAEPVAEEKPKAVRAVKPKAEKADTTHATAEEAELAALLGL